MEEQFKLKKKGFEGVEDEGFGRVEGVVFVLGPVFFS